MKSPDFDKVSKLLYELSEMCINKFSEAHPDKTFYAFSFDLNVEYGNVLLCANTEQAFQEVSSSYIERYNYGEAELRSLKRNFGDWKYQGFNLEFPEWNEAWGSVEREIEQYVFSDNIEDEEVDTFVNEFICMCTKVLLSLEANGAFNSLRKESNFYVDIMDHNENEEEAGERLSRLRAEFNA
ncbi:DUF4303 domain-containing protein [Pleionea litopenaei]|uniref:DUF4303 domain-containing protein n=1 Tax=Pleionea litopenaei TaxID=3070815 RepID=A0AA51RS95_9GAMM|nr:DUF4303 domain-containing protein [Pleionea sp. HL-JVS1]WMS86593.1 DUF4303 domain-containing protein [Pleionea sp. HL-JVS1]